MFIIVDLSTEVMNGYGQYPTDYTQNNNNKWPYVEAKNYEDWQSVLAAMPHLKGINSQEECEKGNKANGMVIRSANDDNVHKVYTSIFRQSSLAYGPPLPRTKGR